MYEDMAGELREAVERIRASTKMKGAGCLVEGAAVLLECECPTRQNVEGARSLLAHALREDESGRSDWEAERDAAVSREPGNGNAIRLAYAVSAAAIAAAYRRLEAQA